MRRRVDRSLWADPSFVKLNAAERLLFCGMLTLQDGTGRVSGDPGILRKLVFPFDEKVTTETVLLWRNGILQKDPSLTLYEDDGVPRIFIGNQGEMPPMIDIKTLDALAVLRSIPGYPIVGTQDAILLYELQQEFPGTDAMERVKAFKMHVLDNPRKNPRLALRNWFMKGAQFAAERALLAPSSTAALPMDPDERREQIDAELKKRRESLA